MRLPRVRFTIRRLMIAVALFALILGGLSYALRPKYSRLSVVNRSGQIITALSIGVGGQDVVFQNIAANATATAAYPTRQPRHHDEFSFNGTLANGLTLGRTGSSLGFKGNPRSGPYPVFIVKPGGELAVFMSVDPTKPK